jgi:hypothetical protein
VLTPQQGQQSGPTELTAELGLPADTERTVREWLDDPHYASERRGARRPAADVAKGGRGAGRAAGRVLAGPADRDGRAARQGRARAQSDEHGGRARDGPADWRTRSRRLETRRRSRWSTTHECTRGSSRTVIAEELRGRGADGDPLRCAATDAGAVVPGPSFGLRRGGGRECESQPAGGQRDQVVRTRRGAGARGARRGADAGDRRRARSARARHRAAGAYPRDRGGAGRGGGGPAVPRARAGPGGRARVARRATGSRWCSRRCTGSGTPAPGRCCGRGG